MLRFLGIDLPQADVCERDLITHPRTVANHSLKTRKGCHMGLPQRVPVITPAEYLRLERAATYRSEYFRGEIFAMAGGTPKHSLIKANVMGTLWSRLRGLPCRAYDSDLRIKSPTGLYTYPDASVICSELEVDDENQDTVLNPTLLVEVLSKGTEAYDRGKKFDHYRTMPSLREYVLVSQDEPMIQRFLRNDDNTWTLTAVAGLDQTVTLCSIGIDLPLAEVYERIDFSTDGPEEQTPL